MDDDDDAPPPLSSLSEQVQALQLSKEGHTKPPSGAEVPDEELPKATTTIIGASKKATPELKRGFFDAKPKPKPKQPQAPPQPSQPSNDIPMLKAKKPGIGQGGPAIPDFLRVEPDEQAKRLEQVKGKLVEALQPTPDTVAKLSSNPALMAGFDDPEVMVAVGEIAKDPSKAHTKYKENKKVQAFYSAMAAFAGSQLEAKGSTPI